MFVAHIRFVICLLTVEDDRTERELYRDNMVHQTVQDMEDGSGWDFVAAGVDLCDSSEVDMLCYKHDSYQASLTGVAEDSQYVEKQNEVSEWLEVLLEEDFANPQATLKSPSFTNRDLDPGVPDCGGVYVFSPDSGSRTREEVYDSLGGVICPRPFVKNYVERSVSFIISRDDS